MPFLPRPLGVWTTLPRILPKRCPKDKARPRTGPANHNGDALSLYTYASPEPFIELNLGLMREFNHNCKPLPVLEGSGPAALTSDDQIVAVAVACRSPC